MTYLPLRRRPSFPKAGKRVKFALSWRLHCFAKMHRSERFISVGRRSGLSPRSKLPSSKTFADQAVIAIENVRLFKELRERNTELREALEHQTATAEVLGIISRSPTDVQPVLDAIVESATRVCGIDDVMLRLREGTEYGFAGSFRSHTHRPHSKSVLTNHSIAGCASMARSTFPTSVSGRNSKSGSAAVGVPSCQFPFVSRENSLEHLTRVAWRFAPSPRRRSSFWKRSPIRP